MNIEGTTETKQPSLETKQDHAKSVITTKECGRH